MIFCLTIDLVFDGHGPFFFSHGLPFDLWCLKLEVYNWTTGPANIAVYSQLSPYEHLAITDTPLLRTLCKSPAKPIINYIAVALAITDSRYCVPYEVSRGHFMRSPTQHFYCSTLVTTDTLDVFFFKHNVKVNYLFSGILYFCLFAEIL